MKNLVQTQLPMPPLLSAEEWQWAQRLIEDVKEEEKRGNLIAVLFQWDLAVKTFRHLEDKNIHGQSPTDVYLRFHRGLVTALISLGEFLILGMGDLSEKERAILRVTVEQLDAAVTALRYTYEQWHGLNEPSRVASLEQKIFSGGPA